MGRTTSYGRAVRALRAEGDLRLMDMSKDLGLSPSYLSAVELGRKPLTRDLLRRTMAFFERRGIDASRLRAFEREAREGRTLSMRLDLDDADLVRVFARRLPEMTEDKRAQILQLLEGGSNDRDDT